MSEQNQPLSLNEFQRLAMRTAFDVPGMANQLAYCSMALTGESGELADLIKKVLFHGKKFDAVVEQKMLLEAGDILWGLAFFARTMNTTLEKIAAMNVAKLEERYPDGFSVERANNRPPVPAPPVPVVQEKPKDTATEPAPTTPVLSQMASAPEHSEQPGDQAVS